MDLLKIIKLSTKTWKHNSNIDGDFILSKFYAKQENTDFLLVESYGAKRRKYKINEIEVYNIGGSAETFSNFEDLFLRLEELNYPAYIDGEVGVLPYLSNDISTYEEAEIPLDDEDKLIVFQGGVPKEVAKSEIGGGDVNSVNNKIGVVVLDANDVGAEPSLGFTPANKAGETFTGNILAPNLSGTNTGDETISSIQTKRPLKTINSQSLEGSGNISVSGTIPILSTDPISPVLGESWITEYNSTDGNVIGLGLLFTYTEPTTLEAVYKIKITNEILTIN